MKIILEESFKSLTPFESTFDQEFSIITGKNGSGKSQLVELFKYISINNLNFKEIFKLIPDQNRIQIEGLTDNQQSSFGNDEWRKQISSYFTTYRGIGSNTKKLLAILYKNNKWLTKEDSHEFLNHFDSSLIGKDELINLIKGTLEEMSPNHPSGASGDIDEIIHSLARDTRFSALEKPGQVFSQIAQQRGKKEFELIETDFLLASIPPKFFDSPDLFHSQLGSIFYSYAKQRHANWQNYFNKKERGDDNDSISASQFTKSFPPPWETINKILKSNGILFEFEGISEKDFVENIDYPLKIKKESVINDSLNLSDLSSGERVIIELIIKLFTSDYYAQQLIFPELLVLDEPDAFLHPEMTKVLIDVLYETFVKKLKIKVILVSHSPSTIALWPNDSIYELHNVPSTSLERIEKDKAIKSLIGNIPTLSIDYENHKQVFVEGPIDVSYYQTIFNKLKQRNVYPFNLYFISNSSGKGNCDQVKKIVTDLRSSGNNTTFGIIDWDLDNDESEHIKVHGLNERYSPSSAPPIPKIRN